MKKSAAFIISLFLIGCTTASNENPRRISDNKYENDIIGLSFRFPTAWQLKLDHKILDYSFDLVALGPSDQGFSPIVSILYGASTGTVEWPVILDEARQQLQLQFADLGNYRDTILDMDGIQFAELSYTTSTGGKLIKYRRSLISNNKKEITVTYTDFASRFDSNADFESISLSLRIY